jgi:hypothetical protein
MPGALHRALLEFRGIGNYEVFMIRYFLCSYWDDQCYSRVAAQMDAEAGRDKHK